MDVARLLYSEISFKPAITNLKNVNNQSNQNNPNNQNNSNNHNSHNNHNNHAAEEFQAPKHQLCDPSLIKLEWLQSEGIGGGLINVGNTCFLNSVLQCLTYCPPFFNFLTKFNGGHSKNCKLNQSFCMLCEMERHVKRIKSSSGPIKPISIVQRLKYINRSFQFGRQEDAHEFLRYLIDHMWKACLMNLDINSNRFSNNSDHKKLDPRIKETTFINHIFGGYHRSQVLCLSCNSRSNTFDYFMDIILDIRNAKSITEALKKFTQPETLENENAYKCNKCRKKVTARKKFTIYKAPNVATFQLKRFDSDRIFGGKITKFISYPEELDLRPYMSDPTKPAIYYQLSAVLIHLGHSTNSGHYFCFIKNSDNFWYKMDDSTVSMASLNTVLQQSSAYVLFYTRKANLNQNHSLVKQHQQFKIQHQNHQDKQDHQEKQNNHDNKQNGAPQSPKKLQLQPQQLIQKQQLPSQIPPKQPQQPQRPINGISTWSGSKSKLEDRETKNDMSERDQFNEELDRGKTKKIKRSRDETAAWPNGASAKF